ncbi:cytochrome c biogenesis protein ResB [Proteinivorax tanatarense]|uniref:Cytochrome c biogenesis protein ResB n=1 Tax=Proteinivorax tanatarense TaxID=1260629 RepID=A0AAU7VNH3_9FIRM
MKTGIVLLIILASVSVIGTLIPQERPMGWYQDNYSNRVFTAIEMFNLDDMYHSRWFFGLFILLSLNLFLCSIVRLPKVYQRFKKPYIVNGNKFRIIDVEVNTLKKVVTDMGFKKTVVEGPTLHTKKGFAGFFGSWLTHLGMLIIIVGYVAGIYLGFNYQLVGVAGDTVPVSGTDVEVYIDDFVVDYREDNTVDQYYSYVTVSDGYENKSGEISVNNPLAHDKYNFYQLATGWMLDLEYTSRGETTTKRLYQRDEALLEDGHLAVRVLEFRPDAIDNTPHLKHPMLLYQIVQHGRVLDMNVTEFDKPITWMGRTITFTNPQQYTVLEVSNDPTLGFVSIGATALLVGLFLSFYVNPSSILCVPHPQGGYEVTVYSAKFVEETIENLKKELEGVEQSDRKNIV